MTPSLNDPFQLSAPAPLTTTPWNEEMIGTRAGWWSELACFPRCIKMYVLGREAGEGVKIFTSIFWVLRSRCFYLECRKTSLCFRSSQKKNHIRLVLTINNLPLWSVITKTAGGRCARCPPLFSTCHLDGIFRCWKRVQYGRWLNKLWKWCQGPISMLSIWCNDISACWSYITNSRLCLCVLTTWTEVKLYYHQSGKINGRRCTPSSASRASDPKLLPLSTKSRKWWIP